MPKTPDFKDDDPQQCDCCDSWIWPGHKYFIWNGGTYCSKDCAAQAIFDKYEDDIEERHIRTAEDKRLNWADEIYEEGRS